MRILQRGGNPTQLGDALAHFGRIFKTLHVLSYVDREQYRRDIKRMRNLQEERHRLAKYICHGRRGELREKYHAGMEDQLGALGLVVNCVALWNTVYLDRILATLRESGYPVSTRTCCASTPTGTPTSTCTATTRSNRCNWPKVSGDDRCGTQATPTPTRSERG
jgi:hypothetical protein